MKLLEIAAFSGAPFENAEISNTKLILLDQSFPQTKTLLEGLTIYGEDGTTPALEAAQSNRKLLRSQLAVWFDKFKDGTIAIKGGKRGTDYSNQRDKETLRGEIRTLLGLPEIPPSRLLLEQGNRRKSSTTITTRSY